MLMFSTVSSAARLSPTGGEVWAPWTGRQGARAVAHCRRTKAQATSQQSDVFNARDVPPWTGSARVAEATFHVSRLCCGFLAEPGAAEVGALPGRQPHGTVMVIVSYRLIDFYILSKSGSYTTWFII